MIRYKLLWAVLAALLMILAFWVGRNLEAAPVASRRLEKANGAVLGYVEGNRVLNSSRSLIGYIDDHGTYNASKRKIAGSPLPGLLFCGEI